MQIDITVSLIQLTGHFNVQFSDCHSLFMQTDFLLDDLYNNGDDVPAPIAWIWDIWRADWIKSNEVSNSQSIWIKSQTFDW